MPRSNSAARKTTSKAKRSRSGAESSGRELELIAGLDVSMLESSIGYNLRRAQGRQMQRFRAVFGKCGVRPVQLSVLAIILLNPEVRQSALGKALDMKRANVVTVLDELEQRKLVARRPAAADRRSRVLHLTPTGRKLAERLVELHARFEQDIEKTLGKRGREELLAFLHAVRDLDPKPDVE